MALIETVVSVLGGAVAKKMVGDWLKDNPLAEKIGEEIVDAIKDALSNSGTTGEAKREIDKLGTEIVTRMQTVLRVEMQRLDEEALVAVNYEAAQALRSVVITLPLLIQINLDGDRLTRYILAERPLKAIGLSPDEQSLYRRLIQEASYGIVAAAGQLRDFGVTSTAEILDRIDFIISQATQKLEMERREAEDFEQRYRAAIERELDRMETFGIPRMDSMTGRQKLSVAYITLAATRLNDDQVDKRVSAFSQAMATDGQALKSDSVLSTSMNINDALKPYRRFAIRGEAGAGKSTLLQWLAIRAVTFSCPSELAHWNGTTPFFIRLRTLVGQRFPAMDQFPSLIDQNFTDAVVPRRWVDQQLRSGRALVLIDGIDELPLQQRGEFFDSLRRLVSSYPLACYIVTSRPSGLKDRNGETWQEWEDWTIDEGFINLTIERMSQSAVEQFIERWHIALAAANRPDDQRVDLVRTGANLKRLLRQRPELRRISTTPLICAMICALHRERGETLPHERILLYGECINLLLSRRDEARRISLDDIYPAGLKDTQKRELIQSLAYWMLGNGYSSVSVERVENHFERLIPQLRLANEINGSVLREFFIGRSGLLREPTIGKIDFAHRSFQEFLAAQEALDEDNIGVLIENATNDQWREVIIVAAGLARTSEREELLLGLIRRGDSEPSHRSYLYLLAVACLETSGRLAPAITSAVIERARVLIPPKNDDEMRLIAGAGDEIVPLLQPNEKYSDYESSMCVKALGEIGTSAALNIIADYARYEDKGRFLTIQSFSEAWDNFDRVHYAQKVLLYLDWLSLDNINSTEDFALLVKLSGLYLNLSAPVDLSLLTQLPGLKELALQNVHNLDLQPLAKITGLNCLAILGPEVDDFSWLQDLHNLNSLSIGSASLSFISIHGPIPSNFDLNRLSDLTLLQELSIAVQSDIDLAPLIKLSKLRSLQLSAELISNLHVLTELEQLRRLDISTTKIDLADLAGCIYLTHLSLGILRDKTRGGIGTIGFQVKHFKLIQILSRLRSLAISLEQAIDLSPVGNLMNLEELVIWTSSGQNLTPLKNISTLSTLEIWDMSLSYEENSSEQSTFYGIEELTSLRTLRYNSSSSSKLSISPQFLSNLTALEELEISTDKFLSPQLVTTLAALPKLQKLILIGQHNVDLSILYEKPGLFLKTK